MSFSNRIRTRTLLALQAGLMLTASSAFAADPGTVVLAMPVAPTSLDACDDSTQANARILRGNVVEALTQLDPNTGEAKPLLATEWKQTDENTWLFTIRPGVTFQDGVPLDAAAVAFGINRLLDANLVCLNKSLFPTNMKASVESDMVVKIVTESPDPILPARITYIDLPSPNTPANAKSNAPIGTGPYAFASQEVGQSVTLKVNPKYWGSAPQVQQATFTVRSEPMIRVSMIAAGEADIAYNVPFDDTEGMANARDYATNSVFYLRPMLMKPPLNDLRVRQAVAMAIDKQALTDVLLHNAGTPTGQLVTQLINGYVAGYDGPAYDPEKAKSLLAEAKAAGVAVDTPIVLVSRNDLFIGADELAQAMQQMLQQVGFTIELKSVDSVAWSPWARKPDSLTQPVNLLTSLHPNISGDASLSFPNYFSSGGRLGLADGALDEKLKEAAVAQGEQRAKDYQAIGKIAYDDQIVIPVAALQGRLLVSDRIDYRPNGFTNIELHLADIKLK